MILPLGGDSEIRKKDFQGWRYTFVENFYAILKLNKV